MYDLLCLGLVYDFLYLGLLYDFLYLVLMYDLLCLGLLYDFLYLGLLYDWLYLVLMYDLLCLGLMSKDASRSQTVREVKKEAERRSRERKRFYVNIHGDPEDIEEAEAINRG